jgi:hypothetical protein
MKTQSAVLGMPISQTTEFRWGAAALLILALMLWALVGAPLAGAKASPGEADSAR